MTIEYKNMAIVKYLAQVNTIYYGKIQELKEVIQGWLSYVPQTFPHYTRHTIEHSEEIILQISKILFREEDHTKPTVQLSAVEAYILIVSAYLHDAGMVVSDSEKIAIIGSDSWKNWTSGDGGGAKRWAIIESFRHGQVPADVVLRNFIADNQIRFLIAEFVRKDHHFRAANLIKQDQSKLAQYSLSDRQLQEAISNVCVGHGLDRHELEDEQKYPERRDIRGEPVNIRFLSLLLRIGDLLDMSYDRACPLLMNIACPVPNDSLAHWSQYARISHRLTAPDVIEISAACETQNEHRILQDWCNWLVDEVENMTVVMSKAARHCSWRPPYVSLSEPKPTISIRPSRSATYFPSKWVLDFDRDAIIQRLIYDVHNRPIDFLRELIQNALDATRLKMYLDLVQLGIEPPTYPTMVEEGLRRKYPIYISLKSEEIHNKLSGEIEKKQVLVIEDNGIGMDKDVVERYFLQIGRSYYTSDEYRRLCQFMPISRFGIGFLSVFAVSDYIVVDTYKHKPSPISEPIRITLTGPRTYLLSERGTRRMSGTRIEVRLRESIDFGEILRFVQNCCRMVEFPVKVSDYYGDTTCVESEKAEQYIYELPDITEDNAKFIVRSFPIDRNHIKGNLFVFSHLSNLGERWDRWNWANYVYPRKHPAATAPQFATDLYCFHGITPEVNFRYSSDRGTAFRIDYRGASEKQNLSRQVNSFNIRFSGNSTIGIEISKRWEEIVSAHLSCSSVALSEDGWKYKQRLVHIFPLPLFWRKLPGTVPLHVDGALRLFDLETVLGIEVLRVIVSGGKTIRMSQSQEMIPVKPVVITVNNIASITENDLLLLSEEHREEIFAGRKIKKIERTINGDIEVFWEVVNLDLPMRFGKKDHRQIEAVALPEADKIGYKIHKTTDNVYEHCVMNADHPLVRWFVEIYERSVAGDPFINAQRFETLLSFVFNPLSYGGHEVEKLQDYLEKWRKIQEIKPEHYPPDIKLSAEMFER